MVCLNQSRHIFNLEMSNGGFKRITQVSRYDILHHLVRFLPCARKKSFEKLDQQSKNYKYCRADDRSAWTLSLENPCVSIISMIYNYLRIWDEKFDGNERQQHQYKLVMLQICSDLVRSSKAFYKTLTQLLNLGSPPSLHLLTKYCFWQHKNIKNPTYMLYDMKKQFIKDSILYCKQLTCPHL